ncbi:MAG: ATP/GTP-binding protein [Gammaproteobacteria bacterium]|nr:ATP/GTP-binding protein [Gammaproteobacteria bacterium]
MHGVNKIIFAGPVGVGKTTAINTVSDIPTASTEAKASDEVSKFKSSTTVAMDYGVLSLDGGEKLHLYGTPGQDRFDFMWEILVRGGIGLILLLDASREDPLADLKHYVESFGDFIHSTGMVVGITRHDSRGKSNIHSVRTRLEEMGLKSPVFTADGRNQDDVKTLLISLLIDLDPRVHR